MATDIYAMGCLMLKLIAPDLDEPFSEVSDNESEQVLQHCWKSLEEKEDDEHVPIPELLEVNDVALATIIRSCLQIRPESRPSSWDLLFAVCKVSGLDAGAEVGKQIAVCRKISAAWRLGKMESVFDLYQYHVNGSIPKFCDDISRAENESSRQELHSMFA